jgi:hypothetical protein
MRFLLVVLGLTLAACGADGEPRAPAPKPEPTTGIRVSGTARVGISVGRGAATPLAPIAVSGF